MVSKRKSLTTKLCILRVYLDGLVHIHLKKLHQCVAFTNFYPHAKVGLLFQCVKWIFGFQWKLLVKKLYIIIHEISRYGCKSEISLFLFIKVNWGPFSYDLLLFLLNKALEIAFIALWPSKKQNHTRNISGIKDVRAWKVIDIFTQTIYAHVPLCHSSKFLEGFFFGRGNFSPSLFP